MTMTFNDWYDKIGYKLEEELCDWYARCPSYWAEEVLPEIGDILNNEYESYVGEMEDYAYECYKDSLLGD